MNPTPPVNPGRPKSPAHLVEEYLALLLSSAHPDSALPDDLRRTTGASPADLDAVRTTYPLVPGELVELWARINGTEWSQHPSGLVHANLFGLRDDSLPYALNSCQQVLEARRDESLADWYGENPNEDEQVVGPGIDITVPMGARLLFADGGGGHTSLYVDFTPTAEGTVGQVLRARHDPDCWQVVAPSFADFLRLVMEQGMWFVSSEEHL